MLKNFKFLVLIAFLCSNGIFMMLHPSDQENALNVFKRQLDDSKTLQGALSSGKWSASIPGGLCLGLMIMTRQSRNLDMIKFCLAATGTTGVIGSVVGAGCGAISSNKESAINNGRIVGTMTGIGCSSFIGVGCIGFAGLTTYFKIISRTK